MNKDVKLYDYAFVKIAKKGDYILLKASHSYEMHTILDSYNDLISKGT